MKSNGEYLLEIIEYGKGLLEDYKDSEDFETFTALIVLLHVEQILDKGRIVLTNDPESVPDPESISQINKGMDEIRTGIFILMKRLGKEKVRSMLESVGENFKINFVSNL